MLAVASGHEADSWLRASEAKGTPPVIADLGLERFDAEGRSRLAADPIALPFPAEAAVD
jgi:hypothetical protein